MLEGNACVSVLCGEGEYKQGSQCLSCPTVPNGVWNKQTAHTTASCTTLTCNRGFRLSGSTCVAETYQHSISPPTCK
jgi:hypothetical protein